MRDPACGEPRAGTGPARPGAGRTARPASPPTDRPSDAPRTLQAPRCGGGRRPAGPGDPVPLSVAWEARPRGTLGRACPGEAPGNDRPARPWNRLSAPETETGTAAAAASGSLRADQALCALGDAVSPWRARSEPRVQKVRVCARACEVLQAARSLRGLGKSPSGRAPSGTQTCEDVPMASACWCLDPEWPRKPARTSPPTACLSYQPSVRPSVHPSIHPSTQLSTLG